MNLLRAALREPVAGGKPVSIMQNVADDLLDGAAEPHDLNCDADDQPSGDYETCQHPVAKNRDTSHHVAAVSRPCRERVVSMSRYVASVSRACCAV